MVILLTVLFVILAVVLAIFVLLQQGKGDMGLGSLANSTQMLFGGSGGQNFFEKATWVLGGLFILGSLGLCILKTRQTKKSLLENYMVKKELPSQPAELPTEAVAESAAASQSEPVSAQEAAVPAAETPKTEAAA